MPHEARSLGFVNRVVPRAELEAAVDELAAELAAKAPNVVRTTKRQVNEAIEAVASTTGSWADADLLGAALRDPDARRRGPGVPQLNTSVTTSWKNCVVSESDSTSIRSLWPWKREPYSLASSDGLNSPAP